MEGRQQIEGGIIEESPPNQRDIFFSVMEPLMLDEGKIKSKHDLKMKVSKYCSHAVQIWDGRRRVDKTT